ncbi:MAG: hypothetical protein CVU97_01245 [Firmicutes bacterium HGW-Firmicutes-21]|nr:MAG: hypothetical protein CVU97_01245 [Firmicutes bacterium HGW-Firmicutes-21]
MILSASRRTDIPCYYSEWFINRLNAGYVLTRNPFNHAQLSKIPLSPEVVDCIVFWTKDAKNILPHLRTIDEMDYNYYFQFTLTPYDHIIEKNLRDKADIEKTFIVLSEQIGKERVIWRYDPIIFNDTLTVAYHKAQFKRLCEKLSPYTEGVIISFVDVYEKLKTNLIREITGDEIEELGSFIGKTAREYGLAAKACCESTDLTVFGIERASCIDKAAIEKVCGSSLAISSDKNQRDGCGCMESIDIGVYNTCLNGCVYCYANDNPATTLRRYNSHNPNSELLIGTATDGERITDRKVKAHRQGQINLF